MACASTFVLAQDAAPAKPAVGTKMEPKAVYGKLLSMMEEEFVSAAEAMPEDKFNFAPTQGEFTGVRSFGDQVKHVAEANGYFFHDPTKPMVDNRADIEKLKTKAEIIKALKDSFTEAHVRRRDYSRKRICDDCEWNTRRDGRVWPGAHDGPLRTVGGVPALEWHCSSGEPKEQLEAS
jgi:hypothetical protein